MPVHQPCPPASAGFDRKDDTPKASKFIDPLRTPSPEKSPVNSPEGAIGFVTGTIGVEDDDEWQTAPFTEDQDLFITAELQHPRNAGAYPPDTVPPRHVIVAIATTIMESPLWTGFQSRAQVEGRIAQVAATHILDETRSRKRRVQAVDNWAVEMSASPLRARRRRVLDEHALGQTSQSCGPDDIFGPGETVYTEAQRLGGTLQKSLTGSPSSKSTTTQSTQSTQSESEGGDDGQFFTLSPTPSLVHSKKPAMSLRSPMMLQQRDTDATPTVPQDSQPQSRPRSRDHLTCPGAPRWSHVPSPRVPRATCLVSGDDALEAMSNLSLSPTPLGRTCINAQASAGSSHPPPNAAPCTSTRPVSYIAPRRNTLGMYGMVPIRQPDDRTPPITPPTLDIGTDHTRTISPQGPSTPRTPPSANAQFQDADDDEDFAILRSYVPTQIIYSRPQVYSTRHRGQVQVGNGNHDRQHPQSPGRLWPSPVIFPSLMGRSLYPTPEKDKGYTPRQTAPDSHSPGPSTPTRRNSNGEVGPSVIPRSKGYHNLNYPHSGRLQGLGLVFADEQQSPPSPTSRVGAMPTMSPLLSPFRLVQPPVP